MRASQTVFVVLVLLFAGCLGVPLGDPETSKVDPSLVGFWIAQRPDSDEGKMLAVSAFDGRCYLITQYNFIQGAQGVEINGGKTVYKAWLTPVKSATFVTRERMDAKRLLNKDDKPYEVARIVVDGSTLTARAIQPEFVEDAKVATSAELAKLVNEHLDDPQMYMEAEVYERITGERLQEVRDILFGFGEGDQ